MSLPLFEVFASEWNLVGVGADGRNSHSSIPLPLRTVRYDLLAASPGRGPRGGQGGGP